MRYLSIDFGSKRIGIALSDKENKFALPYSVFPNNKDLMQTLLSVIGKEGVTDVVVGQSLDYKGEENIIMKKAKVFVDNLKLRIPNIIIHWETELLTSAEAERIQGKNILIDASAAALILRSYLERKHD